MNKKLLITAIAGSMLPAASYAADLSFGGEVEGGLYNDGDNTAAEVNRAELSVSASQQLDNGMTAYAHIEGEYKARTGGSVLTDDVHVGLRNDTWDLRFGEVGSGVYNAQAPSGSSGTSVTNYGGVESTAARFSYSLGEMGDLQAFLYTDGSDTTEGSGIGVAYMGSSAGVNYAFGYDSRSYDDVEQDSTAMYIGGNYGFGNWTVGAGIYTFEQDASPLAEGADYEISNTKIMVAGSINDITSLQFEYRMGSETATVGETEVEVDPTVMYLHVIRSLGGGADVKFAYMSKDFDTDADNDTSWQLEYQLNF